MSVCLVQLKIIILLVPTILVLVDIFLFLAMYVTGSSDDIIIINYSQYYIITMQLILNKIFHQYKLLMIVYFYIIANTYGISDV